MPLALPGSPRLLFSSMERRSPLVESARGRKSALPGQPWPQQPAFFTATPVWQAALN